MTMLPNTFCVFILTHGRPDNVITLKTLEKCGYTGRLYLVVDDEDKTIDRYRQNFGDERVIVFDKKAEADACDEGNNFDEHRTILMARNVCFKIAEKLGITHFIELDDDYSEFRIKINGDGEYIYRHLVKNLDHLFLSLLRYYESANITSIALGQGGDFFGSQDDWRTGKKRLASYRKCMNSFLCSTERPFRFIGAMNEDVNTYTTLGSRGVLFLTTPHAALQQAETQSQSGGITGMYQRFGTYCKAFTTVMMLPSAVRVSMLRSNNPRIHHTVIWRQAVPVIISDKYRKAANIRSDYAPLAAPPNPRADEARAAMREYMRPTLINAQRVEVAVATPLTDEAKISAALAHWPNLQPYAATARVETLTVTLSGGVLARGEVVTVTVFEKGERE